MAILDLRTDGSERVKYNFDGYQAYIRRACLSSYANFAADSHWHDDIELIAVLSGSMQYNVNGKLLLLKAGEGVVVNSRRLHYGFSDTHEECEFLCILLHPLLLCATPQLERDFVAPAIAADAQPYLTLSSTVDWQREVLAGLHEMYARREGADAPLWLQGAFFRLWAQLCPHLRCDGTVPSREPQLSRLKEMLAFVQNNYSEPVSLADIAAAGHVSRSTCLALFKRYIKDTPGQFLIRYRLKQAAALLRETDLPVSEIALSTGFSGISYFTETFHRFFDCTPSAYRRGE